MVVKRAPAMGALVQGVRRLRPSWLGLGALLVAVAAIVITRTSTAQAAASPAGADQPAPTPAHVVRCLPSGGWMPPPCPQAPSGLSHLAPHGPTLTSTPAAMQPAAPAQAGQAGSSRNAGSAAASSPATSGSSAGALNRASPGSAPGGSTPPSLGRGQAVPAPAGHGGSTQGSVAGTRPPATKGTSGAPPASQLPRAQPAHLGPHPSQTSSRGQATALAVTPTTRPGLARKSTLPRPSPPALRWSAVALPPAPLGAVGRSQVAQLAPGVTGQPVQPASPSSRFANHPGPGGRSGRPGQKWAQTLPTPPLPGPPLPVPSRPAPSLPEQPLPPDQPASAFAGSASGSGTHSPNPFLPGLLAAVLGLGLLQRRVHSDALRLRSTPLPYLVVRPG